MQHGIDILVKQASGARASCSLLMEFISNAFSVARAAVLIENAFFVVCGGESPVCK